MIPIRHAGPDGTWLVRDHLEAAIFCRVGFAEMAEGVRAAFELWRSAVPPEALSWARLGTNATEPLQPVGPKTVSQCRDLLKPARASKSDVTMFTICGPQAFNADYLFHTAGSRDLTGPDAIETEANLVEMSFPTEFLAERGTESFIELVKTAAEALPFSAGYASPALAYDAESHVGAAAEIIAPAALRHPGYDVHRHRTTRYDLDDRAPGARWITFLGPELVERLGGEKALRRQVPGVVVDRVGKGLMLRAGAEPEAGDLAAGQDLPLLRAVARAIEPVTAFGLRELLPLFVDNAEHLERWERRFLN